MRDSQRRFERFNQPSRNDSHGDEPDAAAVDVLRKHARHDAEDRALRLPFLVFVLMLIFWVLRQRHLRRMRDLKAAAIKEGGDAYVSVAQLGV